MSILTLIRYLLGDRKAIETIAGTRHALWIGFLFVLSAGFARECDGEDLVHEPWYLAIPVVASVASSFVLFTLAYGIAWKKGAAMPAFFQAYWAFLGLFWMTAPLAWLYAIPYEHFLSPAEAMRANLATLGVVALWRVMVMIRVLAVFFGYTMGEALFLVMTFAVILALALISFLPVPLIDVMGGIRLSERDQILRNTAAAITQLSCCSLPFWLGGILYVLDHTTKLTPRELRSHPVRVGSLAWLAVASLAVWPFVLPYTQPAQMRRYEIEKLFRESRVAEALEEMSRHRPGDYPPGWEPPPRQFHLFNRDDNLIVVLEELARADHADWVRDAYLDRMPRMLRHGYFLQEEQFQQIGAALKRIPGGWRVVERMEAEDGEGFASKHLREVMEKEKDHEKR